MENSYNFIQIDEYNFINEKTKEIYTYEYINEEPLDIIPLSIKTKIFIQNHLVAHILNNSKIENYNVLHVIYENKEIDIENFLKYINNFSNKKIVSILEYDNVLPCNYRNKIARELLHLRI